MIRCTSILPTSGLLRLGSAGLLLATALFLSACSGSTDEDAAAVAEDVTASQFRNVNLETGYVGDVACFQCHESQYNGFKEHGMANSFFPLSNDTAVERFDDTVIVDRSSGYEYRTFKTAEGYFMEEVLRSPSGSVQNRLVREMEYVVGSGTVARTYLTEENGWFYELPITWYTNAETWDFSPGYESNNSRFDRKIADRCMACHNSVPESIPQTDGAYASVPFGIGCEKCHGPGQLHVDERLASPEPEDGPDYTIVNPAHLSLDRQLDVCQQCHLNSTVSLLRTDRTAYDFRPSQDLADWVSFFDTHEQSTTGAIGVISHADRMKQSACFTETLRLPDPLQCTTCHDPHEGFRDQGPSYFNVTCQSCHAPDELQSRFTDDPARLDHLPTANCIACHMPKADLEEAPHSSFTDHWIRVIDDERAPAPIRTAESGTLRPYFERDTSGEGRMYEGMANVTLGRQTGDMALIRKGVDMLDSAASDGHTSGEASYLTGYALQLLGKDEQAIPALEAALLDDPDRVERLNALAQAYQRTGRDPVKIEQLYRRALVVQSKRVDVRLNYGQFLELRGRLEDAIVQYIQAIADEPWNVLAHFNLGTARLQDGRIDEAVNHLEDALQLDPRYVPAWSNLGFARVALDDLEGARTAFEQGVAINPRQFEALDNLGTFHLNNGRESLAVEFLERALDQAPDRAGTRAKLALAWFRLDDMVQARREAEAALRQDPSVELARQILGAL
ncbi:MAG: tetratricopeptide repeat protein [Rhodothermales bacterium]